MPKYTPTESRILTVLRDGMPHRQSELMACLNDELTDRDTLHQHLFHLRRKMEEVGLGIVFERLNKCSYYRKTRLVVDTSLTE